MEPVFNHLQYLGAQSFLFYNDDTTMQVEEARKKIQAQTDSKRKGIFTTGIVCEDLSPARIINLFFTDRQHAGENLAQLLDNNITERLLKSSILHRKNSPHYRTLNGAKVGDCYMSVIETCRANGVNPMDYMMAVVKNSKAVEEDPDRWMPWNYKNPLNPESPNTPPPS